MNSPNFRVDWIKGAKVESVELEDNGLLRRITLDTGIVITGEMAVVDNEYPKMIETLEATPEKTRKYYEPHYRLTGEKFGQFAGLVCTSCNTWQEFGHSDNCPVGDIEKAGLV